MPTGPAARMGDPTAHGNPLAPGPPSPTVIIGGQPAWLGCPAAALAAIQAAVSAAASDIAQASAASAAAKGTPASGAADANLVATAASSVANVANAFGSTGASIHMCAIVKVLIPDGPGIDTTPSATVQFNSKPACRMGDTIQEVTSVNTIAAGCMSVIIGG
ncbi:MAG: hypothetical protein BGO01_02350 [Armatimonadetes bacterium 55-13]|nr:hypothetical protein [Armatimonadota bacterium]ODU53422.1 MAG: hypothetical protein ABT09_01750 [bacterium SCN 57-13]OJU65769.1 MAG: hypothetical protein BGO01_02350 [Armatimonadetes bacterium 55-13]